MLLASALWGSTLYVGGQARRRLPFLVVVALGAQAAGLVAPLLVLAVRGHAETAALGWGAAAANGATSPDR